ncbi:MAG: hypothetical protein HQK54_10645 [Oligoflexales bacterium]|nr:hypothetical protein [Oligoflexales bacterium]
MFLNKMLKTALGVALMIAGGITGCDDQQTKQSTRIDCSLPGNADTKGCQTQTASKNSDDEIYAGMNKLELQEKAKSLGVTIAELIDLLKSEVKANIQVPDKLDQINVNLEKILAALSKGTPPPSATTPSPSQPSEPVQTPTPTPAPTTTVTVTPTATPTATATPAPTPTPTAPQPVKEDNLCKFVSTLKTVSKVEENIKMLCDGTNYSQAFNDAKASAMSGSVAIKYFNAQSLSGQISRITMYTAALLPVSSEDLRNQVALTAMTQPINFSIGPISVTQTSSFIEALASKEDANILSASFKMTQTSKGIIDLSDSANFEVDVYQSYENGPYMSMDFLTKAGSSMRLKNGMTFVIPIDSKSCLFVTTFIAELGNKGFPGFVKDGVLQAAKATIARYVEAAKNFAAGK